MKNYPKILKKVRAEMARRFNYNTGIEQLMTILMKVQSDEAQKRKLFNLKYGRNIVLTSPS